MPDLITSAEAGASATTMGIALVVYLVALFALALFANGKVHSKEDYLVAGRSLGWPLASATLLATWFGAGTLLTATEEIHTGGASMAALDPLGAGLCIILAGVFFARPLREMGLLTLADFYRERFGPTAERAAALIMIPSYFGWIAAQFVALAGVLNLFFGIPSAVGIALVAVIGIGYTLLGGMWSVTLTDAVQISLVVIGVCILAPLAIFQIGDGSFIAGWERLIAETPTEMLSPVPMEFGKMTAWLGVLAIGTLGNLPGQDLFQRVFAAKDADTARRACLVAGSAYLALGVLVVAIGLGSRVLMPEHHEGALIVALANRLMSAPMVVVFTLAVVSAVFSTIDSAILSPASVLSENLVAYRWPRLDPMTRVKLSTLAVGAASLVTAWSGESAYQLLEEAYAIGLAGLLVPLVAGLWFHPKREASALWAMGVGIGLWAIHLVSGWETFLAPLLDPDLGLPVALCAAFVSIGAFALSERRASS